MSCRRPAAGVPRRSCTSDDEDPAEEVAPEDSQGGEAGVPGDAASAPPAAEEPPSADGAAGAARSTVCQNRLCSCTRQQNMNVRACSDGWEAAGSIRPASESSTSHTATKRAHDGTTIVTTLPSSFLMQLSVRSGDYACEHGEHTLRCFGFSFATQTRGSAGGTWQGAAAGGGGGALAEAEAAPPAGRDRRWSWVDGDTRGPAPREADQVPPAPLLFLSRSTPPPAPAGDDYVRGTRIVQPAVQSPRHLVTATETSASRGSPQTALGCWQDPSHRPSSPVYCIHARVVALVRSSAGARGGGR